MSDELMQLLLMADPDPEAVGRYIGAAEVLVAEEAKRLVGVAVVSAEAGVAELKNLAVAEAHRGRGIAKAMIAAAQGRARSKGAVEMVVGTGNSSVGQLCLYQKCGFRMLRIEKDYFAVYPEPIIENGIRCLDRVVLRADLRSGFEA
ncbi:MAG: GNAT family N-acetyltransferase [Halioglobus sp.]|nr:GNAT family N-acetyltransferase [Halioglobus sp.]